MKRILFIDGSNLFGGLTDLLKPGEYIDFAEFIAVIEKDLPIDHIMFYGTYMRIEANKPKAYRRVLKTQKAFFDDVKQHPKVSFRKGHFSGAGKEKGVDVMLAVDLAVGAATDRFNEAVIMTGDADLRYAVQTARKFDKPIHLAALGSRVPFGIVSHTNRRYVYDVHNFFKHHANHMPREIIIRNLDGKVTILK